MSFGPTIFTGDSLKLMLEAEEEERQRKFAEEQQALQSEAERNRRINEALERGSAATDAINNPEGFNTWFAEVAQTHGLNPDPDAFSNAGFNYRTMYSMGTPVGGVPTMQQRFRELENKPVASPDPQAAARHRQSQLRAIYADARFRGLNEDEIDFVLGEKDPVYGGLSDDERSFVRGELESGFGEATESKSPIPEWLQPRDNKLFIEDTFIDDLGLRGGAEGSKQMMRALYEGFTTQFLAPTLDLGANLIDIADNTKLARFMYEAQGYVPLMDSMFDWAARNNLPVRQGDLVKLLRTAAFDVANHGMQFESDVGPLTAGGQTPPPIGALEALQDPSLWANRVGQLGPGGIIRATGVGAGAMLGIVPKIVAGARLLGGGRFGTMKYFAAEGALAAGGAGTPAESRLYGAAHGALVDLLFKGGSALPVPNIAKPIVTGELFGLLAAAEGLPPDEVAGQFFVGLGLGAHHLLRHPKAHTVADVMAQGERALLEIEQTRGALLKATDRVIKENDLKSFAEEPYQQLEQLVSVNQVAARAVGEEIPVRTAYREIMRESLEKAGIPKDQQGLVFDEADGLARSWARNHGRSADEWYLMNSFAYGVDGTTRAGRTVLQHRERGAEPPKDTPIELPKGPPAGEPRSEFRDTRADADIIAELGRLRKRGEGVGASKVTRTGVMESLKKDLGITRLPQGAKWINENLIEFTILEGPNKGRSVWFGNVRPQENARLVEQQLFNKAEFERAYNWYEEALPVYEAFMGPEGGKWLGIMHFAAQRNKGVVPSMGDFITAAEQVIGGVKRVDPKTGRPRKAGLADSTLRAMMGGEGELRMGPKLHDFNDSLLLKNTRTYMGDHMEGGQPYVGDLWSGRVDGQVDVQTQFGPGGTLRAQLSPKQLAVLERLPTDIGTLKLDPTDAQLAKLSKAELELYNRTGGVMIGGGLGAGPKYEYVRQRGERMARYFNDIGLGGRHDWMPHNAQSVTWIAMQKAYGVPNPEFPIDALVRNTRRIAFELDSAAAPYSESYRKLPPKDRELVTRHAMVWALPRIFEQIGSPPLARARAGQGGWQDFVEASGWIDVFGSKETSTMVGRMFGHAAVQEEVLMSRMSTDTKGKQFGLWVSESGTRELVDSGKAAEFARVVFELDPRVKWGFDQAHIPEGMENGGSPGIRIMFPKGAEAAKQRKAIQAELEHDKSRIESGMEPEGRLMKAVSQASDKLGINVRVEDFFGEFETLRNDWAEKPNGADHLSAIDAIEGPAVSRWVRDQFSPEFRRQVEGLSQRAARGELPGADTNFETVAAETRIDLARRLIENEMSPELVDRFVPAVRDKNTGKVTAGGRVHADIARQREDVLTSNMEVGFWDPQTQKFLTREAASEQLGRRGQELDALDLPKQGTTPAVADVPSRGVDRGSLPEFPTGAAGVRRGDIFEHRERGSVGPRPRRVTAQTEIPAEGVSPQSPALIRLFENATVASVSHEFGHLMRQTLTPAETRYAEAIYGVKDGKWTRAAEERFADDFERYLARGEFKDPEIGESMGKLAHAIKEVYHKSAPSFLEGGIIDSARKAQFERWLSPEKARTTEPGSVGREESPTMSVERLMRERGESEPLLSPESIYEATRAADTDATRLKGYADNINVNKIRDAGDVRQLLHLVARTSGEDPSPRVERQTFEQTAALADEMGMTVKKLLENRDGRLMSAEELTAARSVLQATSAELIGAAEIAANTRAPEDMARFYRLQFVHKAVRDEVSGQISKVARALGSLRLMLDTPSGQRRTEMLDLVLDQGGGPDAVLAAATRISTSTPGSGLSRQVDGELSHRFRDALYELWVMGLLSGFKTQARNFLSNSAVALMAPPEAFLAATIGGSRRVAGRGVSAIMGDRAPQAFTNQDRTMFGETLARTYGFLQGGLVGTRLAARVVAGSELFDPFVRSTAAKRIGASQAIERLRGIKTTEGFEELTARQTKLTELRQGAISAESFGLETGPRDRPAQSLSERAARAVDFAGNLVRTPGLGLEAGDAIFKAVGYAQELQARAYRQAAKEMPGEAWRMTPAFRNRVAELASNPTREMLDAAEINAGYQTFTNPLGPVAQWVIKGRQVVPGLRLLIPFMLAPTNVIKRSVEMTPAAAFSKRIRETVKEGGSESDRVLARAMMGSMLLGTAAWMGANGMVTGDPPSDPALRAAWLDRYQPRSFLWGDPDNGTGQWVSYEWAEPFSTLVAIGAGAGESEEEIVQAIGELTHMFTWASNYSQIAGEIDTDTASELATAAVKATTRNFINKTWWRGLHELTNAVYNPERYGARWANAFARSAVPRAVTQVTQNMDPTWREAFTMLDTVKGQIPGWSRDLKPRRNYWGQPLTFEGGLGPDMVSPLHTKQVTNDPVYIEVEEQKVSLRKPRREVAGIELTPDEYDWLVGEAGPVSRKMLADVIENRLAVNPREWGGDRLTRDSEVLYKDMLPHEKRQLLKGMPARIYSEFRQALLERIMTTEPQRVTDPILRELGIPGEPRARPQETQP